MNTVDELKEVYESSAKMLEEVRDEYKELLESEDKKDFYTLKYMGILIYNDLAREYYNLESNPTLNTSKLVAISPIIHKSFEAQYWYKQKGNKKLRELSDRRGIMKEVDSRIRKLKSINATRIEKYKNYRDKMAGHYDIDRIELIEAISSITLDQFKEDTQRVIIYGNEWLGILKYIGSVQKNT